MVDVWVLKTLDESREGSSPSWDTNLESLKMRKWQVEQIDLWERDAFLVSPTGERFYFQFGINREPTVGDAVEYLIKSGEIEIIKGS